MICPQVDELLLAVILLLRANEKVAASAATLDSHCHAVDGDMS